MPQPSANYRNSGISTIIRPAAEVTTKYNNAVIRIEDRNHLILLLYCQKNVL